VSKYNVYEHPAFTESIALFPALAKKIDKRKEYISQDSTFRGEKLRYELSGLRSVDIENNKYIIVFMVIEDFMKIESLKESKFYSVFKEYEHDQKAVVLLTFDKHDEAYASAKKLFHKLPAIEKPKPDQ